MPSCLVLVEAKPSPKLLNPIKVIRLVCTIPGLNMQRSSPRSVIPDIIEKMSVLCGKQQIRIPSLIFGQHSVKIFLSSVCKELNQNIFQTISDRLFQRLMVTNLYSFFWVNNSEQFNRVFDMIWRGGSYGPIVEKNARSS